MDISRQALRDARSLRKWTQAELAERLDVSQKTIVNWERYGVPPKKAYSVHRVLGKALEYARYRLSAPADFEVEDYEEWIEQENHLAKARLKDAAEGRLQFSGREQEVIDEMRDIDEQERYEQHRRFRRSLEPFTTLQLLEEIGTRFREVQSELSAADSSETEMSDAEAMIEVHPEGTKSTYGLAAYRGVRKADEIPHAE